MQAKIYNFADWIAETQPEILTPLFDEMIALSGFTVLDTIEHHFEPQGFTKLYLLAESHFAIHTFPEEGKTYIELSSCNFPMYLRFKALYQSAIK